jgi:hypothetical protein
MKHLLLTLLLATLCVVSASGQTIRTLGFNTTNGNVIYGGTNTLTFTNAVKFSQVIATAFKAGTNFSALEIDSDGLQGQFKFKTTNTNDGAIYLQSFTNGAAHKAVILGIRENDAFIQSSSTNVRIETSGGWLANLDADTISVTNSAATRTNLGLGGGLITNISIIGTNNTNTLVFSNGILKSVQ